VFLATKFALNDKGAIDGSPAFVRASIEKALKRLDLPYVDLFYVHRLDKGTPIEKTVEELKKIKEEGLIKYIGLSECSSESLRRACKVEHIDCVQVEYSPFSLEIESEQINLLKTCRELGVATVAYSPIGRGILGGKLRSPDDFEDGDFRRFAPRFSKEVRTGVSIILMIELSQKPRAG
jgi:aryl-alcohol dehydrogenase-like predicted oxidoreductase